MKCLLHALLVISTALGAKLINCPINDVRFEKVLGLRPPATNNPLLLFQSNERFAPIVKSCIEKCQSNNDCISFVVYYNTSSCFWFKSAVQGSQEFDNIVDPNTAWFLKQCYNVKNCEKQWTFERVPGATLIGNNTKRLPDRLTRSECQQSCLDEAAFECRSAKFRITPVGYGPGLNQEMTGVCTLSSTDRHISPNSYRVSNYEDEYFENQCVPLITNITNEFCAYEEYPNATLSHFDLLYAHKTKDECQELCENNKEFNCRGFSLTFVSDAEGYNCLLHSEDTKVHGPKLLLGNPKGQYFERAQCINITLSCTETYMTVTYNPRGDFRGRLYMEGYSEQPQCFAQGKSFDIVTLKLPLLSKECGIIKVKAPDNRTLMAGTMVLQYNPLIQTQGDRAIRVGCIYGNDSKILVGTGITISTAPNTGSAVLNSTGVVGAPTVTMYVLDLATQEEVSSTQIGQELQLTIDVTPPNGPYDIWAGHLVAMTENSAESILLIDDRGCPTNINIFPQLEKIHTNKTLKLISNFQAFKFSTSPIVRFSVIVQFCTEKCAPIDCGSLGRRKRAVEEKTIETVNGPTVVKVNRTEFERGSPSGHMMPLEFVMIVRDGTAKSDKLVVSDGKVLVAGYDYSTNQVCIDYSLFIGMLVTCVLVQIIFITSSIVLIKRYKTYYEKQSARRSMEDLHKNFGFGSLENRRVHWADNRGFT